MTWKEEAATVLQEVVPLDKQKILSLLEKPKKSSLGDLAFPCFVLAKEWSKSPVQIATELAAKLSAPLFSEVKAVGPYVNMFIEQQQATTSIINEIISKEDAYGQSDDGQGGTVTIDLSHPNIAKPFSMGHLRSTVIGNSLANLATKNGYAPIKINHLGDWGTQFGKLIVAYRKWGDRATIEQKPIAELLKLYVRFHDEATPELEDEARKAFKDLEDGAEETHQLWQWFREESLTEFNRIYQLLSVTFDSYKGEAYFANKIDTAISLLQENDLLVESDNALVVTLEEYDLPPVLIKKSDGATLYATRDLAAAIYRQEKYNFVKSLYVVGNEQSLYFKQLQLVLEKANRPWAQDIEHIAFGMILSNGKKLSTRKGHIILLEEVLADAIALALKMIKEKNPHLANKEQVAEQIGVGAIIFHDLKHHRQHDIDFSLEAMLSFEGETGPYLQYTYARSSSLLEKANYKYTPLAEVDDPEMWPIITLLAEFPQVIKSAWKEFDPSKVARFALDLARRFNQYYAHVHILSANDKQKDARLAMVMATNIVIKEALRLLGIKAPSKM